jgi:hypothetical protein
MNKTATWLLPALLFAALVTPATGAEKRWKLTAEEDEISGEKMHSLAVAADDGSVLVLTTRKDKEPILTLVPAKGRVTIFPDKTDIANKAMFVNLSMRSTVMDKPHSASWRMSWMDYGKAFTTVDEELARKVLSGDSVTFQFDKMGKRIKFPTKGEGLEGLAEAIDEALAATATAK